MRRLLSPRWLAAHLFVTAVCVTCVVLGFWQLDRLDERRLSNTVQASRLEAEPLPLADLLAQAGTDLESLEFRRATISGTFVPDEEVLIRSQVVDGQAGFDIITPLVTEGGDAVAVNRGWVPLEYDSVPVMAAPPPDGTVTVEGLVRLSQQGTSVQPDSAVLTRVDLDLLDERIDADLLPVYLEVAGNQDVTTLPVAAAPPDFIDEGPHFNYAIQWFSFALVGAVGYGFLLRRAVRHGSGEGDGQILDDLDARETGEIGPREPDLGGAGTRSDHD